MPITRNNYSLQARPPSGTMTVASLRRLLESLSDDLPVVILSPKYWGFGSENPYSVVSVEETVLPRMEAKMPSGGYYDDDGELVTYDAETQVWPEWRGVIIQGDSI